MANKNDLVKPSESSQAQGVEGNQWKSRETKRDQVKQDRTNRVRGTPNQGKSRETKRDQVKQDRTNRVRGTPSEYVVHIPFPL